MIKDPNTKVEIPKEDTPSTPTVKENEKFEAKISTTEMYDFHNTLNQDNKTGSTTKEITVTNNATINFIFDLKGSGAYTVGLNISSKDETPTNAKDFSCGINSPDYCYKDTIDANHKYSYTFKAEGTYYIYIVFKDRLNNVTLEQKMKIIVKVSNELTDFKLTHKENNGKEYVYITAIGGGSDLEITDFDFNTDDERYFYESGYNVSNLIGVENNYMTLDFKKGCYYKLMIEVTSGNKSIKRSINIQK